jgi:glycosyltransferase involved in cell wall biosynthesis
MREASRPVRILFVITGLGVGGAEMMLIRLLRSMDTTRIAPAVLTLAAPGPLAPEISELGVPLFSLGLAHGSWSPGSFRLLIRHVRAFKPDILQGWMYHGNIAAQLAALFAAKPPVIWNIRGTMTDLSRVSKLTAATIRLGARLSKRARVVINNSSVSAELHTRKLGYSSNNVVVIPNGFDTSVFHPDPVARVKFRLALGAGDEDFLIGHVGRLHPMKDHETLIRAATICIAAEPRARFVLVGDDVNDRSQVILDMAAKAGIGARVRYLGPRKDVAQILPGLDLFTLTSSYGEGFPNAVGEAMACGVPCVATDVGDSAHLIGRHGAIVPPGDAQGLADAWLRTMRLTPAERNRLGEAARHRIQEHFSLAAIVQQYQELYDRVARQRAGE